MQLVLSMQRGDPSGFLWPTVYISFLGLSRAESGPPGTGPDKCRSAESLHTGPGK